MASACPYDDDAERKLHAGAIQSLAMDLGMPEEKLKSLYEPALTRFKESARIKDFLAILVSRTVKDMIKEGIHPKAP
jgi:hypothetical protein